MTNLFINRLYEYHPTSINQIKNKEKVFALYNKYHDFIFDRKCPYHVTSSSIILNENLDEMLCIYHNIYQNYGWTGGHNDLDFNCLRVAIKEAMEETGIVHFRPLNDKIYSIDFLEVNDHIKNGKIINGHMHINFTYVFIASTNQALHIKADENSDVRWIKVNNLKNFTNEENVLKIYLNVINKVKEEYKNVTIQV